MLLMLVALLWLPAAAAGQPAVSVRVASLRTEQMASPLGLDKPRPRFSWQLEGAAAGPSKLEESGAARARGLRQASYRILVGQGAADGTTWDSGLVVSSKSVLIRYGGPALASRGVYRWTVEVVATATGDLFGDSQNTTATAPPALFSMGVLSPAGWSGQFIGLGSSDAAVDCPWFRKSFLLPAAALAAAASDAMLTVASVGFHEVSVNGQLASEGVLLPSVSFLPKRVLYRTYNVSSLLKPGKQNAVGIWAAAGWAGYKDFRCNNSFDFDPASGPCRAAGSPYAQAALPLVLAELHVGGFALVSDSTWKASKSTISHLGGPWGGAGSFGGFGGEAIDDSNSVPDWAMPDLDDSQWENASEYQIPTQILLSADTMEPTVRHSTVPATEVTSPSAKLYVVQMQELFTGWFEVRNLRGAPGTTVNFSVSTSNETAAEFSQVDSFTFGHTGRGEFTMKFSYHAIQFITVVGLDAPPDAADVSGYRLTSLGKRSGHFECSNQLLTQMYAVTVNNYRGLTTGGFTVDCPHRERRGFGGDAHTSFQFGLVRLLLTAFPCNIRASVHIF
jgi:alpha-L-rhamnosidase